MSIYNTPHVPHPVGSEDAGASLIDTSSPTLGSSQEQEGVVTTARDSGPSQPPPLPSSSSEEAPDQSATAKSKRRSFPFSFAPRFLFQSGTFSSTSLAPSTAEGKPIPLGDTTAGSRTSALQKLNSTYPSISDPRHRYAKSTGAQSGTYSQPVIVRTYSGHSPSTQAGSRSRYRRQPSHSRGASRRVPLSAASTSGQPTTSSSHLDITTQTTNPFNINNNSESDAQQGGVGSMSHQLPMKPASPSSSSSSKPRSPFPIPLPWSWTRYQPPSSPQEEVKLPPLEAFSFKSFINDTTSYPESSPSSSPFSGNNNGNKGDISADLDRIAEICARSRYSLSNQYEVHVAPHGSGESFVSSSVSSSSQQKRGRVLQPDGGDENSEGRSGRRQRGGNNARRKSVAYGTLETIMSSSRSCSEEGGDGTTAKKKNKKGAREVVDEVRGRAGGRGKAGSGSGSGGSSGQDKDKDKRLARKRSASFANAIMDSSLGNGGSTREEGLMGEIALPRVSGSHLGVRTSSVQLEQQQQESTAAAAAPRQQQQRRQYVEDLPHEGQQNYYTYHGQNPRTSSSSLFGSWIPWQTTPPPPPPPPSHSSSASQRRNSRNAEGRLRELLKTPPVRG